MLLRHNNLTGLKRLFLFTLLLVASKARSSLVTREHWIVIVIENDNRFTHHQSVAIQSEWILRFLCLQDNIYQNTMLEFEDVLREVGGFGRYQKCFVIFFIIPMSCLVPWVTLDSIFMVSVPDHWCAVPGVASSNLSVAQQRALVSPPDDPRCSVYDYNFTHDVLSEEDFATVPNDTKVVRCASGWQYDTSNYQITAATKWNLVCDHMYYPSLVLTLAKLGSFVMSPLYGFLADRYGRKTMYLVISTVASVSEVTSALVDDFVSFTIARVIVGSTMPSLFTMPFILLLEIVAPEMRGHMNGIMNIFWTVGFSLLPLVVYLTGSYVYLGFVSSLASGFVLFYCRWIPESPCWLISKGKYEEAAKILERIGEVNGQPQNKEYLMGQLQILGDNIKKKRSLVTNKSAHILIQNPRIRRHFFILALSWTAFNATYFGPFFNIRNFSGNEFVNFFLLSIVEIPGNILFWILMDRAGRRWTGSLGFLIMGFVFLGTLSGLPYADTIFTMISKVISTGIFMVVDQQGIELFPTVFRSFCIVLAKTLANIITLLLPFIADLGFYNKAYPFLIMSGLSFVAGILSSFLPETLNENLPQTVSDAGTFGKDQKYFSWIRKKSSNPSNGQNTDSRKRTAQNDPTLESINDEAMKMIEVDLQDKHEMKELI